VETTWTREPGMPAWERRAPDASVVKSYPVALCRARRRSIRRVADTGPASFRADAAESEPLAGSRLSHLTEARAQMKRMHGDSVRRKPAKSLRTSRNIKASRREGGHGLRSRSTAQECTQSKKKPPSCRFRHAPGGTFVRTASSGVAPRRQREPVSWRP
jgi:hypothetical protein